MNEIDKLTAERDDLREYVLKLQKSVTYLLAHSLHTKQLRKRAFDDLLGVDVLVFGQPTKVKDVKLKQRTNKPGAGRPVKMTPCPFQCGAIMPRSLISQHMPTCPYGKSGMTIARLKEFHSEGGVQ